MKQHDTGFMVPAGQTVSTEEVATREQFAFWNDMICAEFVQLDCSRPGDGPFRGVLRGCQVENIRVSEVHADPQHVLRSRRQIARAAESEFLLSLQLEDVGMVNQDGRTATLYPGDFALYDSTRPYFLHFERPFRQIVLQIPYDSLADRFLDPSRITARKVSARTGVGRLTSQFIRNLAASIDTLSIQERRILTEHVIELVAVAMGSASSLREVNGQSAVRHAMIERIKQYIDFNAGDPSLSPAVVARHHGISERYQRMLFAATGTTVSRYILDRRLEMCRETLENPVHACRSVTEVAFSFGFNDAAHFSRKFREKYGESPSDCRARARRP